MGHSKMHKKIILYGKFLKVEKPREINNSGYRSACTDKSLAGVITIRVFC
jgi:hypothetical protein